MKLTNLKWIVILGAAIVALSACSPQPAVAPPATRAPTQTPWIIYVPVTPTPEPFTVTPLPTVTPAQPPRTATRTAVPRAAAPTRPPATAVPTVPPAPKATTAPACSLGTVTLIFPDNGAPRKTKRTGPASDTFDFKWTPIQPGEGDAALGYRISIESKKGSRIINADIVDVQHNKFIRDGEHYIYDAVRISNLASPAGGENVTVTWTVTVIKAPGGYSASDRANGAIVTCGAPTLPWVIELEVLDT